MKRMKILVLAIFMLLAVSCQQSEDTTATLDSNLPSESVSTPNNDLSSDSNPNSTSSTEDPINTNSSSEIELLAQQTLPKIMIIVGNEFGNTYFEMKEALEAKNYQVDTIYVGTKELLSSCPNHDVVQITGDIAITDITDDLLLEYEGLFIPSGKHHRTLPYSKELESVLLKAKDSGLFISSVCAGNFVLASCDTLIDDYSIACTSYTRETIEDGGGIGVIKNTVTDGPFITGDAGGGKTGNSYKGAPIDELATLIDEYIQQKDALSIIETYDFSPIIDELSEVTYMNHFTVSCNQQMLVEEYYRMQTETFDHNVFSVTKSVTSMLVGIAIEEGYIEDVNQKLSDFIDLSLYDVPDSFYDITLHHLLTMSSGIAWDGSRHVEEFLTLKETENPLEYIMAKGHSFDPGEQFNYSDATAHLTAEVLTAATGLTPYEYAVEKLFSPLDIDVSKWTTLGDGVNIGGCDLFLTSHEMDKIGQLILNDGSYNGQSIVPKAWLDEATTPQMERISSSAATMNYGYYFWLGTISGYEVKSCIGHGGQFIVVVPDLRLVITASTNGAVATELASAQLDAIQQQIYYDLIYDLISLVETP